MERYSIKILFYDPSQLRPIELTQIVNDFKYVEDLMFHILKQNNVGPIYRSLFGLKLINKSIWFAPNYEIRDLLNLPAFNPKRATLELRMRFRPNSLVDLKKRDLYALNILFAQIKYDFIYVRLSKDQEFYSMKNPQMFKLIALDLVRIAFEKNLTDKLEQLFQDITPKEFIPRRMVRLHKSLVTSLPESLSLSKYIEISLRSYDTGDKVSEVKRDFVIEFLENLCPDYWSESFRVMSIDNPEDRMELRVTYVYDDLTTCKVETRPLSSSKPRCRVKDWTEMCDIYSISFVALRDKSVEINRENGPPIRIIFETALHAKSFLALIDGYYRLMRKWHFNFCRAVISPDLDYLRSIKCHGPIGHKTAERLLRESRKPIALLVRRSAKSHDNYIIDVAMNSSVCPINRSEITTSWDASQRKFKLPQYSYKFKKMRCSVEVDHLEFDTLKELIDEIQIFSENYSTSHIPHWLLPSEYGDYPSLMLSMPKDRLQKLQESIESKHAQPLSELPRLIPEQFIRISNKPTLSSNNSCEVKFAELVESHREVVIKSHVKDPSLHNAKRLNLEAPPYQKYLLGSPDRFRLGGWMLLRGPLFADTIGIGLDSSVFSLIQEHFPLGTLDKFLARETNITEEFRRLISCHLASAVMALQEKCIVHGKIRCHNVFVKCVNPLTLKLADYLGTIDPDEDRAFIPHEYFRHEGHLRVHGYDSALDIWALGTTLWQVYSGGKRPQSKEYGNRLKQPKDCPDQIWKIIESCWHTDPARRASPQIIYRDLHDAYVWAVDSHSYDYIHQDGLTTDTHSSNGLAAQSGTPVHEFNSENGSSINEGSNLMLSPQNGLKAARPKNLTGRRSSLSIARSRTVLFIEKFFGKKISAIDSNESYLDKSFLNLSTYTTVPGSEESNPSKLYDIESLKSSLNDRCYWQVDSSQLKLGVEIGRGSSGVVHRGMLSNGLTDQIVAVKCFKDNISYEQGLSEDLKKEFDILKGLDHENIIKTLGFVEETYLMLILEYMPLGNLQSRLKNSQASSLSSFPLKKYALGIAKGMEYLESVKVVHRDLALRNILVKNDDEVKICDFGLAQYTNSENIYKLKTNRALPVKWYAPESLETLTFTHKSDVWSFGVVLWEIYSGGATPQYPGPLKDLIETLKYERLKKPKNCPNDIYELMLACWAHEPNDRENFTLIKEKLMMLPDISDKHRENESSSYRSMAFT